MEGGRRWELQAEQVSRQKLYVFFIVLKSNSAKSPGLRVKTSTAVSHIISPPLSWSSTPDPIPVPGSAL